MAAKLKNERKSFMAAVTKALPKRSDGGGDGDGGGGGDGDGDGDGGSDCVCLCGYICV